MALLAARRIARLCLRLSGWSLDGPLPPDDKYVCIAVPHTSNWDGVMLVMLAQSVGLSLSWMAKESVFRGPQRHALERLGAVAIDRGKSQNVVAQMIDEFRRREQFRLVVAPEGTRGRTDYWKSGFYHIALGAEVPLVPGYMDYEQRRAGLGPPIRLTGDAKTDMDRVREYYDEVRASARFPGKVSRIRLRDEDVD